MELIEHVLESLSLTLYKFLSQVIWLFWVIRDTSEILPLIFL
jgi:hypothetical protein